MCGIAGFFGDYEPTLLEAMNRTISHRGPDDEGSLYLPEFRLGLAHRRLSIIDLSAGGHQPMWDATGTVCIVFNGEIFNFEEWRSRLQAEGHTFKSNSDTEVILNLYLRYGAGVLSRLNGMFAFALWDSRDESLLVARDGVGVKPLYYTEGERGFLFASELKALLQSPHVSRELDAQAIEHYVTYLWCPSPRTMLSSVKKLEPGFALRLEKGRVVRRWCFYDLPYGQGIRPRSPEDSAEEVREAVRTAVHRQLVSDVPVGALLSGGLDSSSVVALAQEKAQGNPIECFTIGFRDEAFKREGSVEDLPYAERVADYVGANLSTVVVGPEMSNEIERLIYHLDEPQADLAGINAYFICKVARDHGIKVLLSGAGGDDIFSGYRRHYALRLEQLWNWLPHTIRSGLRRSTSWLPANPSSMRRLTKAFSYADREGDDHLASYFYWLDNLAVRELFSQDYKELLADKNAAEPMLTSLQRLPEGVDDLNRMLYLEGKHFLADHNLNYFDKMSMATGVEVRVPLLDPDLIALAATIVPSYKQRGRTGKWIFKRAMEPLLPKEIIYRPKSGFGVPLRSWLRNELRDFVEDTLSVASLKRRGIFDPVRVRALLEQDRAGKIDAAYTILSLSFIELWCRLFKDNPHPSFPV